VSSIYSNKPEKNFKCKLLVRRITTKFAEDAERQLNHGITKMTRSVQTAVQEKRYMDSFQTIAELRPSVDFFFDKVMVMVDDETSPQKSPGTFGTIGNAIPATGGFFSIGRRGTMSSSWVIPSFDKRAVDDLTHSLNISPTLARLLLHRGLQTPLEAGHFLNPDLSMLHDPFLFHQMEKAVNRIKQASSKKRTTYDPRRL
jgi:hypothetical protein